MNNTFVPVFLGLFASLASAQTVINTVGRYGIGDDGNSTLHYEQIAVQQGRWIPIDVFNVDFGKPGTYRESYVGGGAQVLKTKRITLTQEVYFGQTTGPASKGAAYILPWTRLDVRWSKRFTTDVVEFTYAPVNTAAKLHWVVDRARLNYDVTKLIRVGAGWAGSQCPGVTPLVNKPLGDIALKTKRFGTFELWAQHAPGKKVLQLRWYKTFGSKG